MFHHTDSLIRTVRISESTSVAVEQIAGPQSTLQLQAKVYIICVRLANIQACWSFNHPQFISDHNGIRF